MWSSSTLKCQLSFCLAPSPQPLKWRPGERDAWPPIGGMEQRDGWHLRPMSSSTCFVNSHFTVRLLELGHLEEDYPITRVSEHKRFSSSFANRPITFINLRAVSWEVRQVRTVFNVYNGCIVQTSILLGHLQKNLKILFAKKHCDWIIFFQVPRVEQLHYKTLWERWVTWTASGSHKVPSTLMCELTANTVEPHGWPPLVISDTSHLTHWAFFLASENKCQKRHLLLQDMQGSS